MSHIQIIADPGSCHMGYEHLALGLVHAASDAGADAIKFQLLTSAECRNGNIAMDWEWLPRLMDLGAIRGIEVFASVFDQSGIDWLRRIGCRSVKFAYSQGHRLHRRIFEQFRTVYSSHDVMNDPGKQAENHVRLYCIPEYPVRYDLDFEGIFERFDGFSSHCLGIAQDTAAVQFGARVLEKHLTLDRPDIRCPDHRFALKPAKFAEMVTQIRALESADSVPAE